MIAKTTKTDDHGMISKRIAANGGPTTWPAEPAAVVIPNASDLFSADAVLPTTAKIGPKPLPAIPNPIKMFKNWCASGEDAVLLINTPKAYRSNPIAVSYTHLTLPTNREV